ncbi:hypothetical protein [Caballeronia sp. GaOx3]|uniref:hypothetical protein n=1 Tax=Caballeronia sp. GaOx3 TaxID=2921740 RepID=UPI0020276CFE|nr:hypothetical protein [Caballeronia sp. GaOx3]
MSNTIDGSHAQFLAALATGNTVGLSEAVAEQVYQELPQALRQHIALVDVGASRPDAVLYGGDETGLLGAYKAVGAAPPLRRRRRARGRDEKVSNMPLTSFLPNAP